jgi:hypothetical protein
VKKRLTTDHIGTYLVTGAGNGAAETLTWTAAAGVPLRPLAHEFDANGAVAISAECEECGMRTE